MNSDYSKFIEGERIYLRGLLDNDVEGPYQHWLNNKEVCQGNSHHIFPYSKQNATDYISQANTSSNALILAIALQQNDLHIGNIALQKINWIYRIAELAILLGDKNQWGKGIGLEAARLIIHHGFTVLNLNKIECATFENNKGMQKLALGLGMQQEGMRRHAVYKNGLYLNIIEFGLLREEFKG